MSCCGDDLIYYRGSQEYVEAEITADVILDAQPVEFSLRPGEWLAASWQGSAGTTREARVLVDFGDFYKGKYVVKVRVTDVPEIPIFAVGTIEVRA